MAGIEGWPSRQRPIIQSQLRVELAGATAMAIDRTDAEFAYELMEAARLHGENSEPDHEVGDLQDLFLACWLVMSPEQRAIALSEPVVADLFDQPEYADLIQQVELKIHIPY